MLQDNSPPEKPEQEGKNSSMIIWALPGCRYLGFGFALLSILAVLALPSFLHQPGKSKQSEARTYVDSLNRSQQAYFLENETFSDSIDALDLGVSTPTKNYTYQVELQPTQPPVAVNLATPAPAQEHLRGYIGLIFLTQTEDNSFTSNAIQCKTKAQVSAATPMPSPLHAAFMQCPAGFVALE